MIRVVHKSGVVSQASNNDFSISIPVFGGNPLLVACLSGRASGVDSAPTWNSTAFTLAKTATDSTTFTETAWIYYLVPPAPGTYTVEIPMSGTSYQAQIILLNDVDQSSPLDTTGSSKYSTSFVTEMNPTLTTANDNELVIQVHGDIVANSGSASLNGIDLNDGQTLLGEYYSGPSADCIGVAYKVISTAGAQNLRTQMKYNGNTSVAQEDIVAVSAAFKQSLFPQPNAALLMQLIPNLQ